MVSGINRCNNKPMSLQQEMRLIAHNPPSVAPSMRGVYALVGLQAWGVGTNRRSRDLLEFIFLRLTNESSRLTCGAPRCLLASSSSVCTASLTGQCSREDSQDCKVRYL
ncbi:hypothetical protein GOP47_0029140 [Adiantum capillus-veneris]|nr:hypothetical protein GOP47_0029140 [Adiantum capillus-veneris]